MIDSKINNATKQRSLVNTVDISPVIDSLGEYSLGRKRTGKDLRF